MRKETGKREGIKKEKMARGVCGQRLCDHFSGTKFGGPLNGDAS